MRKKKIIICVSVVENTYCSLGKMNKVETYRHVLKLSLFGCAIFQYSPPAHNLIESYFHTAESCRNCAKVVQN